MTYPDNILRWKKKLVLTAAAPYRSAGRFAWHFARGKLGGDPVFLELLRQGLIAKNSQILDLGCGQGLLVAWLRAAETLYSSGDWPENWPPAPAQPTIRGIELMPRDVQRGKAALGHRATIEQGDIRTAEFGQADMVVILDVLHYMDYGAQEAVLRRVRKALANHGTLLMRIGDAASGWRFRLSNCVDAVVAAARGHGRVRLYGRSITQWRSALEQLGFAVEQIPMGYGTPFANILLVGRV
ncbi:MAG: class I SAM-dependent methyltransferase [Phycisphaerae bacterium]|nr:class I SAM-dependent methyltransferase [Phycisphaerae bacterium]